MSRLRQFLTSVEIWHSRAYELHHFNILVHVWLGPIHETNYHTHTSSALVLSLIVQFIYVRLLTPFFWLYHASMLNCSIVLYLPPLQVITLQRLKLRFVIVQIIRLQSPHFDFPLLNLSLIIVSWSNVSHLRVPLFNPSLTSIYYSSTYQASIYLCPKYSAMISQTAFFYSLSWFDPSHLSLSHPDYSH